MTPINLTPNHIHHLSRKTSTLDIDPHQGSSQELAHYCPDKTVSRQNKTHYCSVVFIYNIIVNTKR